MQEGGAYWKHWAGGLCLPSMFAPDGGGQFTTISEAVLAVPYDCPAVIRIAPGIYREKLVCEKKDITLAGAGMDATRLVWNDGGKLPHPDGRPTHPSAAIPPFSAAKAAGGGYDHRERRRPRRKGRAGGRSLWG